MTSAAAEFLSLTRQVWDSFEPYENTARAGYLADEDDGVLADLCVETGDDLPTARAEVLAAIRAKVAGTN